MSTMQTMNEPAAAVVNAATTDLKLEVVVLPVSDVDRAKRFYQALGWRLDADFSNGADWRVVQFTPPGSPCSIHFGKGLTSAAPGSVQGTYLIVDDIERARTELVGRGVTVSDVFHFDRGHARVPGADPQHGTYRSFAGFSDPDGNSWLLQEVTARLPGRGSSSVEVASLIAFLREAEIRHGAYEPVAPKHHWSSWYAAYIVARERGKTEEEAVADAGRYMDGPHQ